MTIPTYLFYFIAAGTVAVLTTILLWSQPGACRRALARCGSHPDA